MKDILKALELEENDTEENAVAAIQALKEKAGIELGDARTALELADDADVPAIVVAIKALKEKSNGSGPESREFAEMRTRNMALETKVAKLEKDGRISHFSKLAEKWTLIAGTPKEFADRLVALEEKDLKEAEALVATYNATQAQLEAAGADKPQGTGAEGASDEEHEFTKLVRAHMAEKHVDEPTAFEALRKSEPEKYKDFMKGRPIVYSKSPRNKEEE